MKNFQLDIITPTNLESYENVSYLRIPALDGQTGVQARHATAIIGLGMFLSSNVLMMPHMGASTKENLIRIGEVVESIINEHVSN